MWDGLGDPRLGHRRTGRECLRRRGRDRWDVTGVLLDMKNWPRLDLGWVDALYGRELEPR